MKQEKSMLPSLLLSVFLALGWGGCGSAESPGAEEDDPTFERGRTLLRQGEDEKALDSFLTLTRRNPQAAQSHLEVGRLLLKLGGDPYAAIHHCRRFLELSPDSSESANVEQLIEAAKREVLKKLPGEPYADHLEVLRLREEGQRLRQEVADLRVRLGLPPEAVAATPPAPVAKPPAGGRRDAPSDASPSSSSAPVERTYVVQQGDTLYGISIKMYGSPRHVARIFAANRNTLPTRDSLSIGQTLRIPSLSTGQ